ncbi:BLOC-1-related complex subunit 7 isoform X3 [Mustela erminea]|uniref:BLOC-1-related complex subunit 7 isoform X3 n=1 Tax=Mustela erminea TaxID=36723 RepID=UPI001386D3F1|nr:BLOC-1-related complex subunit 7 isoform X3 [Mustela erminea]
MNQPSALIRVGLRMESTSRVVATQGRSRRWKRCLAGRAPSVLISDLKSPDEVTDIPGVRHHRRAARSGSSKHGPAGRCHLALGR